MTRVCLRCVCALCEMPFAVKVHVCFWCAAGLVWVYEGHILEMGAVDPCVM